MLQTSGIDETLLTSHPVMSSHYVPYVYTEWCHVITLRNKEAAKSEWRCTPSFLSDLLGIPPITLNCILAEDRSKNGIKMKKLTGKLYDIYLHTRESMYVLRNNEALSCKHCCNGKAWSIAYFSECVALGIQHAMRVSHIVIRGLFRCTIFFHIS